MKYTIPTILIPRPTHLFRRFKSCFEPTSVNRGTLVEHVMKIYDMEIKSTPSSALGGMRNKTVIIDTDQGKKLLKCYKNSLGESSIIQEHSILKYLFQQNFPVPKISATNSGKTLVFIGPNRYVLYDYIEGGFCLYNYILSSDKLNKYIAIAGSTLAELHICLRDILCQMAIIQMDSILRPGKGGEGKNGLSTN